jgi:RNA polymerase sigma-70 factor (ECF subfamily)
LAERVDLGPLAARASHGIRPAKGKETVEDEEASAPGPSGDDESLMAHVTAGSEEALALLHRRHAGLVFRLAARRLERAVAEEIVQDVFLAVWRRAATFDPARGRFRSWLLQIAHRRILNELRHRSRRPRLDDDPDQDHAASLPDPAPGPSEAAWAEYRRTVVRAAVDALPPLQRQALGLAFFEELTHEQVATLLELRLGTAKTRIRSGLLRVRAQLAPVLLTLVLLLAVSTLVPQRMRLEERLGREERALAVTSSSDVVPLHLSAASAELPAGAHGGYRARPGSETVVLTATALPSPPPGRSYTAWARAGTRWLQLGVLAPDAAGHAGLIAEDPELAMGVDELRVTLESAPLPAEPHGATMLRWARE